MCECVLLYGISLSSGTGMFIASCAFVTSNCRNLIQSKMSKNDSTEDKQSMSDQMANLKILIISGRSGSGKSSTSYEVCHLLKKQEIPHVHIAGDNLDTLYPTDGTPEMMLVNLKLIWNTYWTHFDSLRKRHAGKNVFVIVLDGTAMIMHMDRIVKVLMDVVHNTPSAAETSELVDIHITPILLEASEENVEKRLKAREIGGELDAHIDSSRRMNRILDQMAESDIRRFVNDGTSITDLAGEILKHIGLEA